MNKKIYAILAPNLKKQFANKKLYRRSDGVFELEDGTILENPVVQELQNKGMLKSPTADNITTVIEMINTGNTLQMAQKGEAIPLYRVKYESPYEFAGELIYQKDQSTFVTQKGIVLTIQDLQTLAQQDVLQKISTEMIQPANPYLTTEASKKEIIQEKTTNNNKLTKIIISILSIILITYLLATTYTILFLNQPVTLETFTQTINNLRNTN